MRIYVTEIGTPNERERKDYKTHHGAVDWIRKRMTDWAEWASTFNKALEVEIVEARKEVGNHNLKAMPPGDVLGWTFKDEHTGFTWVFRLWVEEEDA